MNFSALLWSYPQFSNRIVIVFLHSTFVSESGAEQIESYLMGKVSIDCPDVIFLLEYLHVGIIKIKLLFYSWRRLS